MTLISQDVLTETQRRKQLTQGHKYYCYVVEAAFRPSQSWSVWMLQLFPSRTGPEWPLSASGQWYQGGRRKTSLNRRVFTCWQDNSLVSVCPRAAPDENISQLKLQRSEPRAEEMEFKCPKVHSLPEKGKGLCSIKALPRQHEVQGQQRRHWLIHTIFLLRKQASFISQS